MSSPKHIVNLSQSIARLMPNIIQGVHIGFLAKKDLTHTQFFVLVAIHSNERLAMNTLSDNLQVSMPTMSGIIERLVNGGYVKRIPNPKDRRQVWVELTPQGSKVIRDFQGAAMVRWQQVLKALESKEVGNFQVIVDKLLASLQRKVNHEKN